MYGAFCYRTSSIASADVSGGHGHCRVDAETPAGRTIPQWRRRSWPVNVHRTHGGRRRKIVVIGGTGLMGSRLVPRLREHGDEAVAASPDTGVNTLTGEGLAEVLQGASVVVDVSNSPSFEEAAVMKFFTTSTRNLLKYAGLAGVKHYVALSVVGTE